MRQNIANPKVRGLAERLLAYEEATGQSSEAIVPVALRVSEKFRRSLSTLVGSSGFRSLLSRSLALATAQVPGLNVVKLKADGSMEGWSGVEGQDGNSDAGVIITAEFLGLLVTFVGEGLMLNLVRDVWPDFTGVESSENHL